MTASAETRARVRSCPLPGFANSVASPAIEFKTEGLIYGLAAKMFIVAGPIIVYGVLSGTIVGIIYWFLR